MELNRDRVATLPSLLAVGMRSSYEGHAGRSELAADVREAWERMDTIPQEIVDAGDVVVVLGSYHVRARGSGIEFDSPIGCVLWLEPSAPWRTTQCPDQGQLAGASPGMEEEEGSDHGNRGGQEHQLPGDAEDEHREHSHKDERKTHTVRGPCWPRRALLGEGVAAASATRRTLSYSPLAAGARFLRHRSED